MSMNKNTYNRLSVSVSESQMLQSVGEDNGVQYQVARTWDLQTVDRYNTLRTSNATRQVA